MTEMKIFSGSANPKLAENIATLLQIPLGKAKVDRFSDGEVQVEILENVRGKDVFIIQSTCAPTNNHLMELMLIADAIRRASAMRITAVIPYFGYARQDRRVRSARVPISCKIVADMLSTVDVNRILTVDLHADQIQGFFGIPVDNAYSSQVLVADIEKKDYPNNVIVSPDVGGVVRARAFAKLLNDADLAIIDKRRPKANQSQIMNIIGEVNNRHCVIIDDIVDTAGTLCAAAKALKQQSALSVSAYCTHPVFSGAAVENIMTSELDEVVVTDSIPLNEKSLSCSKIRQLSIDSMLSEAIRRVNKEESISCMFN
jgi:ribose-phosphate pyrophosphokinase